MKQINRNTMSRNWTVKLSRRRMLVTVICVVASMSLMAAENESEALPQIESFLAFFPIFIYIIALLIGGAFLMRSKNWRNLISEKRLVDSDKGAEEWFLSLSRLALFVAGLTASLCAVTCTSFFMYYSFVNQKYADMTSLAAIITAVQIGGAIPYLSNKAKKS